MLHKRSLYTPEQSRDMVQSFSGLNRTLRASEGEFSDMTNMTGDHFPVAGTRKPRGVCHTFADPGGMIAKDALCYVDDGSLYINGLAIAGLSLTEGEKQLVGMGAYILIWPDKKWYNTVDGSFGGMENSRTASFLSVSICRADGESYDNYTTSDAAPEGPSDGQLWMDISGEARSLKKWSQENQLWVAISTTYIKLEADGIGSGFSQYDGVQISGVELPAGMQEQNGMINGSHVIYQCAEDYIVIIGLIDRKFTQESGEVCVLRAVPDMDYMTECNNRIWGCKYGLVDGQTVNEIYACKLGDFKNWDCYMGLSADSYRASRGSDGFWTGAITLGGYPLFFKENCVEKVYPSATGAHQIVTTNLRGVQKGSHKSMAVVDEVLYYKSATDICAYDGSLPVSVSEKLCLPDNARNAVAGALGSKYYISFEGTGGGLYVYETRSGRWYKEDGLRALDFCRVDTELFCVDSEYRLLAMTGQTGTLQSNLPWMLQIGIIGLSYPDRKYVTRLNLRLSAKGSFRVLVQYDSSGQWQHKATIAGKGMLNSIIVPILPVRCDHMAIRLEGSGECKLFSITKTLEQGSDVI